MIPLGDGLLAAVKRGLSSAAFGGPRARRRSGPRC